MAAAVAATAMAGCSGGDKKAVAAPAGSPTGQPAANQGLLVAPTSVGKVMSVSLQGRFAVIAFPLGQVPAPNTTMVVYRSEAKVGEVKITGPTQENVTVGDIVLGSVQEKDEVRSN
jgi:hypothetical protein